jgi:hypothetical protein
MEVNSAIEATVVSVQNPPSLWTIRVDRRANVRLQPSTKNIHHVA